MKRENNNSTWTLPTRMMCLFDPCKNKPADLIAEARKLVQGYNLTPSEAAGLLSALYLDHPALTGPTYSIDNLGDVPGGRE